MKENDYLIKGLVTKNEKIILEIYTIVFPKVLKFVSYNGGQYSDAQDVFQNALLQLVVRYNKTPFQIKTSFEAYLFTVCKNLWRRELNKSKNKVTNDGVVQLHSREEDLALATLEQERWELFNECLESISENCRKILKMFFNRVSYREMVKIMGYNTETVARQRVFKCKLKLKTFIKKDIRYKYLLEV